MIQASTQTPPAPWSIDLDAYLARVGWTGPVAPTPEVLKALPAAHAAAIPFENLNPLLGLPVDLDPAAVERKLVGEGRGGYCFEHNLLLAEALKAIGFEVSGLAARVLWNQPETAINARSHMVLRVDLDGRVWLADVGFGGLTLTGALELVEGVEQATPHETFRLVTVDGDWRLQARLRGEWKSLYRFDLQRQHASDYQLANWFTSTSPASHFTHVLVAARSEPGRRLALRNREFAVHRDGETERRVLDVDQILAVLEQEFRIRLPQAPDMRARLEALG